MVNDVIGTISLCEQNMIELVKKKRKYIWEQCNVILLLPLLGVNNHQPLLHMDKTFIYINNTEKLINQFSIGYMVNPKLHVQKVFR